MGSAATEPVASYRMESGGDRLPEELRHLIGHLWEFAQKLEARRS